MASDNDVIFTITQYPRDKTVTVQTERGNFYRGMVRNCTQYISVNDPNVDDGEMYGCFTAPSKLLRYDHLRNGSTTLIKQPKSYPYTYSEKDQYFQIIIYMDKSFRIMTNWQKWARVLAQYWEPEILGTSNVFTGEKGNRIVGLSRMLKS